MPGVHITNLRMGQRWQYVTDRSTSNSEQTVSQSFDPRHNTCECVGLT